MWARCDYVTSNTGKKNTVRGDGLICKCLMREVLWYKWGWVVFWGGVGRTRELAQPRIWVICERSPVLGGNFQSCVDIFSVYIVVRGGREGFQNRTHANIYTPTSTGQFHVFYRCGIFIVSVELRRFWNDGMTEILSKSCTAKLVENWIWKIACCVNDSFTQFTWKRNGYFKKVGDY